MKISVIIPVCGLHNYTHTLLNDIVEEVDILIIDNSGNYTKIGKESVFVPKFNLGWLRACNLGLEHTRKNNYDSYCILNNDTRLSPNFFEGLKKAQNQTGAGLLSPIYDDPYQGINSQYEVQKKDHGLASDYKPQETHTRVGAVDGTCMFFTKEVLDTVGYLDETFKLYGWGGEIDYCIRAKKHGYKIYVTELSYLNHFNGRTAEMVLDNYKQLAGQFLNETMQEKYGNAWQHMRNAHDILNFDFAWFFAEQIPGDIDKKTAYKLWETVRNFENPRVVELGSNYGRTSAILASCGVVMCVDSFDNTPDFFQPNCRHLFETLSTFNKFRNNTPWHYNYKIFPLHEDEFLSMHTEEIDILVVNTKNCNIDKWNTKYVVTYDEIDNLKFVKQVGNARLYKS